MADYFFPKEVLDAMIHFGFAASFEITNGSGAKSKIDQATDNKKFLKRISPTTVIKGGFACFKNKPIKEYMNSLDMIIELKHYNQKSLQRVCEELIDSSKISSDEKVLLQNILFVSYRGANLESLIYPNDEDKHNITKALKTTSVEQYKAKLSNIKGNLIERYIRHIFKRNLKTSLVYTRVPYSDGTNVVIKAGRQKLLQTSDIDALVVCTQSDFEKALLNIKKNEKMDIVYPN